MVGTESSSELSQALREAVESGDRDGARAKALSSHFAELADCIELLPSTVRSTLCCWIGGELQPNVLLELDAELRARVIGESGVQLTARYLADLQTDDVVELLEPLSESERTETIASLTAEQAAGVAAAFRYPSDSAGRLAKTDLVLVSPDTDIGTLLDTLRTSTGPEALYNLFVVDSKQRPLGVLPLYRLLRSPPETTVGEIMFAEIDVVPAQWDQEDVAKIFRDHNLLSVPVIGENNEIIGEITIDDIVDVIEAEAEEDLLGLGGLRSDDLYQGPLKAVRSRFGWLLTNLATAVVASIVIAQFADAIEQLVALAVLMPIVASMSGNAGTQAMTVAVRALAARELLSSNTGQFVAKEFRVGVLNALVFALITGGATAAWFQERELALVMAAAMFVSLLSAAAAGALIPPVLKRLGADPAVGSTVLLTTVTDVVGFLSFLGLASWFLR